MEEPPRLKLVPLEVLFWPKLNLLVEVLPKFVEVLVLPKLKLVPEFEVPVLSEKVLPDFCWLFPKLRPPKLEL